MILWNTKCETVSMEITNCIHSIGIQTNTVVYGIVLGTVEANMRRVSESSLLEQCCFLVEEWTQVGEIQQVHVHVTM